jgi:hemolysin activation/secretion protein
MHASASRSDWRRRSTRAIALVLCAAWAATALGQTSPISPGDRYRYLPRPFEAEPRTPQLPREEKEITGSTEVLVDKLRGLIFLDDPKKVIPKNPPQLSGVTVKSQRGLRLLRTPPFQRVVQKYLGGPVSIRRMNEMLRDIVVFYRNNDLPVVDLSIPEQDVTDGIVQVVVTEARVGKVCVEKTKYFDACDLLPQVCIQPGDEIHESVLLEDMRWLSRNPYRDINLKLKPGQERGTTDVVFEVDDQPPWRFYTGYEDTGNLLTRLERTYYGVNWYNALCNDDWAGYQFTADPDFDRLLAHSGYYSRALLCRDIVSVYGTYAEFSAPTDIVNNAGFAWQVLPRYDLELCPIGCYKHGLTFGWDFKQTNTNLDFGGETVFDVTPDISQFTVGYHGRQTYCDGGWLLGLEVIWSPGDMFPNNDDATFNDFRPGATADYLYARGLFEVRTHLCGAATNNVPLELVSRVRGQLSEARLLPIEEFGLGGYNSIRGYDEYSVIADSGLVVNIELWSQAFHLLDYKTCKIDDKGKPQERREPDSLRFLAFWDYGVDYTHSPQPGEFSSFDISSVGVGLRYEFPRHLSLRADYGFQLIEVPSTTVTHDGRIHLGIQASW